MNEDDRRKLLDRLHQLGQKSVRLADILATFDQAAGELRNLDADRWN
jgi:hypothetical protein